MTEADVLRYNAIPHDLFRGKVLEVGARDGEAQLASVHRERFLSADYLGLDVRPSSSTRLRIEEGDFLSFCMPDTYDTILMLEVAEHLCLRTWPLLFERVRYCLRDGGRLFMTVPYRESPDNLWMYVGLFGRERYAGHVTYGIDRRMVRLFLPDAKMWVIRKRYPFKTPDESWVWAFARFAKRVLLHEPLAWNWLRLELRALIVVWTKEAEKK